MAKNKQDSLLRILGIISLIAVLAISKFAAISNEVLWIAIGGIVVLASSGSAEDFFRRKK